MLATAAGPKPGGPELQWHLSLPALHLQDAVRAELLLPSTRCFLLSLSHAETGTPLAPSSDRDERQTGSLVPYQTRGGVQLILCIPPGPDFPFFTAFLAAFWYSSLSSATSPAPVKVRADRQEQECRS